MTRFTVFIDESGEAGIKKVRTGTSGGASPYFVLGAAVFQPASGIQARKALEELKRSIGKKEWKHATELDHAAKVYFARLCSRLKGRYFAVISNKVTLQEYADSIDWDPHKFYNKCIKYLLELICRYLSFHGASENDISVILEERNHDYEMLRNYLGTVRSNPIYPESRSLSLLNVFGISTRAKGEEALLEFADFTAHAVYQLSNKSQSNYGIPEPRYFMEMSRRFAAGERGEILGFGMKCIHSLEQLQLDDDVARLVKAARGEPLRRPRRA
jgi:hypothetical protein